MDTFEEKLQIELDKLPYEKHLDDGMFNDGQASGFEQGARWAQQQAKEQAVAFNSWFLNKGVGLMLDGKEKSGDELFELFLKDDKNGQ